MPSDVTCKVNIKTCNLRYDPNILVVSLVEGVVIMVAENSLPWSLPNKILEQDVKGPSVEYLVDRDVYLLI